MSEKLHSVNVQYQHSRLMCMCVCIYCIYIHCPHSYVYSSSSKVFTKNNIVTNTILTILYFSQHSSISVHSLSVHSLYKTIIQLHISYLVLCSSVALHTHTGTLSPLDKISFYSLRYQEPLSLPQKPALEHRKTLKIIM